MQLSLLDMSMTHIASTGNAARQDRAAADSMAEQYLQLRDKQFEYFVAGLEKDWSTIDAVRGALTIVQTAAHVKKVVWECTSGVESGGLRRRTGI